MSEVRDVTSDEDNVSVFFEHLTRTGSTLFGDDGQVPCGLMFRHGNEQTLLFSASSVVAEMYRKFDVEHTHKEAPTLLASDATRVQVTDATRVQVTDDIMDDIADDITGSRQSSYFDVLASKGFASILSLPLTIGPVGRAILNFYARPAAFFSIDRQRVASAFAEQAGVSVEVRLRLAQCQDLATNMRSAMESRTSIDVAIGIIIAQNRCSQEEASMILKRASNTRNIKLRDLAASMVVQASGGAPTTHFS